MRRLIFSLSLVLILALAIAGCAGAEEQGNTGLDQTGEEGAAGAMVVETPVVEETQPGIAATEEGVAMATEEPPLAATEEGGMVTEEPEAGVVESPTGEETTEESAQAAAPGEEEVLPPTGTINVEYMSNLLDFEVWNRNNEQIGSVNAIVINQDTSEIGYVIVGTGGFLGLGEKEIPVPWSVLEVQGATNMEAESSAPSDETQVVENPQNVFILDMNQDQLEQTPEFDLSPLYEPETADAALLQQLEQEIQSFWQGNDLSQSSSQTDTADEMTESDQTTTEQSDQMTQTGGATKLVLAQDLIGAILQGEAVGMSDQPGTQTQQDTAAEQDVNQADTAQYLGRVDELTVDLDAGQVNYLLVSLDLATAGVEEAPAGGSVEQPSVGIDPAAGMQEPQLVPVPLQAVDWNAAEQVLIYTGSQLLEQAPAIGLEEFQSGPTNWQSKVDSFWNQ
ncbi:MAG: PRC-barrel domain-containing protein [Chloroflexota bacterium]